MANNKVTGSTNNKVTGSTNNKVTGSTNNKIVEKKKSISKIDIEGKESYKQALKEFLDSIKYKDESQITMESRALTTKAYGYLADLSAALEYLKGDNLNKTNYLKAFEGARKNLNELIFGDKGLHNVDDVNNLKESFIKDVQALDNRSDRAYKAWKGKGKLLKNAYNELNKTVKKNKTATERNKRLGIRINELKGKVDNLKSDSNVIENEELKNKIQVYEKALSIVSETLNNKNGNIDKLEENIKRLEQENASLGKQIDKLEAEAVKASDGKAINDIIKEKILIKFAKIIEPTPEGDEKSKDKIKRLEKNKKAIEKYRKSNKNDFKKKVNEIVSEVNSYINTQKGTKENVYVTANRVETMVKGRGILYRARPILRKATIGLSALVVLSIALGGYAYGLQEGKRQGFDIQEAASIAAQGEMAYANIKNINEDLREIGIEVKEMSEVVQDAEVAHGGLQEKVKLKDGKVVGGEIHELTQDIKTQVFIPMVEKKVNEVKEKTAEVKENVSELVELSATAQNIYSQVSRNNGGNTEVDNGDNGGTVEEVATNLSVGLTSSDINKLSAEQKEAILNDNGGSFNVEGVAISYDATTNQVFALATLGANYDNVKKYSFGSVVANEALKNDEELKSYFFKNESMKFTEYHNMEEKGKVNENETAVVYFNYYEKVGNVGGTEKKVIIPQALFVVKNESGFIVQSIQNNAISKITNGDSSGAKDEAKEAVNKFVESCKNSITNLLEKKSSYLENE